MGSANNKAEVLRVPLASMLAKTLDVLGRSYRLTCLGQKQLQAKTRGWRQAVGILDRCFTAKVEDL
jgi:hypothetical protein